MKKNKNKIIPVLGLVAVIMLLQTVPGGEKLVYAAKEVAMPQEAQIDESRIDFVYYVDQNHPSAGDRNSGTEDRPFKTINPAIRLAETNKRNNKGTKIIIKSGVYREKIHFRGRGVNANTAPIIIEGTEKGKVIISGSELYSNWQQAGAYYTHSWTHKWGPRSQIYLNYDKQMAEIVRRREMIFVNGVRLEQFISKSGMTAGSFYVSESEGLLYMIPPAGTDMSTAKVEVSVTVPVDDPYFVPLSLRIENTSHVVVRNISVEHGSIYQPFNAADIKNCRHVLVEDCSFDNNSWFGFGVTESQYVVLNRVSADHNGGGGFQGYGNLDLLLKNCSGSYNNWRGVQGQHYDWDTGGIKFLFCYRVAIIGQTAKDNYAPGIWFDSECRDILIDSCLAEGNDSPGGITSGIYLEGGIGPYRVSDCIIRNNKRGINIASSNDVHIVDCVIYGNKTNQINVFNNWGQGRTFDGMDGVPVTSYSKDTTIENTVISASPGNSSPLFGYDHGDDGGYTYWIQNGLKTSGIQYYHPDATQAFLLKYAKMRGSLHNWQSTTGLDRDAVWLSVPFSGDSVPPRPTDGATPTQGPLPTRVPDTDSTSGAEDSSGYGNEDQPSGLSTPTSDDLSGDDREQSGVDSEDRGIDSDDLSGQKNTLSQDGDTDEKSQSIEDDKDSQKAPEKGSSKTGFIIAAGVLLAGIIGLLLYYILRLR